MGSFSDSGHSTSNHSSGCGGYPLISSGFPRAWEYGPSRRPRRPTTSPGSGGPVHAPRLWQAASDVGTGGGSESKRMEGSSLAARHKGMVGVVFRGDAST